MESGMQMLTKVEMEMDIRDEDNTAIAKLIAILSHSLAIEIVT